MFDKDKEAELFNQVIGRGKLCDEAYLAYEYAEHDAGSLDDLPGECLDVRAFLKSKRENADRLRADWVEANRNSCDAASNYSRYINSAILGALEALATQNTPYTAVGADRGL